MLLIDTSFLRAALVFAAKKDCRQYLCGVAIENAPDACYVIATDGHRMLICCEKPQEHAHGSLILPRTELEAALKAWNRTPTAMPIEANPDGTYTLAKSVIARPYEDSFPDWRRAVPQQPSGKIGHYDADYLGSIGKVCTALGSRFTGGYILEHNGTAAARILFPGYLAVGLLMPFKGPESADIGWLTSTLEAPKAPQMHESRS